MTLCHRLPILPALVVAGLVAAGARAQAPADSVMRPISPPTSVTPPPAPHFTNPATFDFLKLLPPPPAADSVFVRAEIEVVLQVQAARTNEQVAWAKLVDRDSIFHHAEIVGAWFTKENLPATAVFFKDLGDDLRAMDAASKKPFLRPRPATLEPAIKPCVTLPSSTSYPSGSALQAFVWAELLADLFPAKRPDLEARAHRAAWGRVLGGVHYPSDLVAGQSLAAPFLAECRKSAAFREGLERCRKEVAEFAAKTTP